jgi:hypothetical protein
MMGMKAKDRTYYLFPTETINKLKPVGDFLKDYIVGIKTKATAGPT